MKTFVQLSGNFDIITCLQNTLVLNTCGFDGAYEFEDLDDDGKKIKNYKNGILIKGGIE